MKLSKLKARIDELEPLVLKLEGITAMHHTKRPEPYRGKAEKLKADLAAARTELKELRAWLRGNWFEDDLGAGGGSTRKPARSVR